MRTWHSFLPNMSIKSFFFFTLHPKNWSKPFACSLDAKQKNAFLIRFICRRHFYSGERTDWQGDLALFRKKKMKNSILVSILLQPSIIVHVFFRSICGMRLNRANAVMTTVKISVTIFPVVTFVAGVTRIVPQTVHQRLCEMDHFLHEMTAGHLSKCNFFFPEWQWPCDAFVSI